MKVLPLGRIWRHGVLGLLATFAPLFAAKEVSNFALLDQRGQVYELRRTPARAVVLFFTANGCPVARQYATKLETMRGAYAARGVDIVMVNSSTGDDRSSIAKEMRELRTPFLPVLKDDTQGLARHLGVNRTGEAVVISTKDWSILYRGAVDDQVTEGAQKPAATERYLEAALDAFLADRPIAQTKTTAHGCVIAFDGGEGADAAPVSYAQHVAPILQKNCVSCHSPGHIGSWAMTGHRKVKSMSSMIEEVLLTHRMPPWDADPAVGKFSNSTALPVADAQTLLRWVQQGAPRGEGDDPLAQAPAAPATDWPLGPPDIILRLPTPQQIPATGVIDYRHVKISANNPEAGWVGATWVRPGNNKVVHHVIARVVDERNRKEKGPSGATEMFVAWAPGATQGSFPANSGKPLPANARFDIELHYTTNGSPQTDQTEIGLYLLKEKPALRYESIPITDDTFEIAPGDRDARAQASFAFRRGATLHGLTPHMHFRGRSMKFEVLTPEGRRETVCSVPRYDFNWQLTYQLAQPKKIPAGSWALISGSWDNSKLNPANPDPNRPIHWGEQTFDEMFLGFYHVTWDADVKPAVKAASAKTEE